MIHVVLFKQDTVQLKKSLKLRFLGPNINKTTGYKIPGSIQCIAKVENHWTR